MLTMSLASTSQVRQSSPVRDAYRELSSPDPLGDTSSEIFPGMPQTRRSSATAARQIDGRHGDIDIQLPVSPTKVVTEQNLSPWRIKVTVEAEPEDSQHDRFTGRTRTVTKTMKVPIREDTGSSNGRKKGTRVSTSPVRSRSRTRRQSITNLDIVVLGDDGEEDEWGVQPKSPRRRKSRGNKKSGSAAGQSDVANFEIAEDVNNGAGVANEGGDELARDVGNTSPELREVDLNQVAMRSRQREFDTLNSNQDVRKVSINSAVSYPTPSPTASEHGDFDDRGNDQGDSEAGLDTVMESEGFTMIDLNSLPSVRQMRQSPNHPTMPEYSEAPEQDHGVQAIKEASEETAEAPSIAVTGDGADATSELPSSPPDSTGKKRYCIGHLQLPSSTNVQRHRLVTPMPVSKNPFSSPKLPSPPPAPSSTIRDRSPIHSDEVIRAGSVLHDAMAPTTAANFLPSKPRRLNSRDEETLFDGFSSSTRRELRAELRFGEELAKTKHQMQAVQAKGSASSEFRAWQEGAIVQHSPPVPSTSFRSAQVSSSSSAPFPNLVHVEERVQKERREVVQQARQNTAVIIDSDDEAEDDIDDGETTIGDIWLAEARETSPRPTDTMEDNTLQAVAAEHPRRKLIPSPWKRGEQIEASRFTNDESLSGMLWQQSAAESSSGRFGDAIVAHPDRAADLLAFDRRRSAEFDIQTMTPKATRRLSPRRDDDDAAEVPQACMNWRNAEDVIEEETNELEAEGKLSESPEAQEEENAGTTCLYETNLDAVQDASSSPQIRSSQKTYEAETEHDSTYSSLSGQEAADAYRQRVSLSPSKERPNTPRSALKGGRASFGMALTFDGGDETNARRVVWARKSTCVNEDWEESMRSIRSSQESSLQDTPSSAPRLGRQGIEASFEVQPQPVRHEQSSKGWFGWFQKDGNEQHTAQPTSAPSQAKSVNGLDGAADDSSEPLEEESQSSYEPTSRQTSTELSSPLTDLSSPKQQIAADESPVSRTSSTLVQKPIIPNSTSQPTPSYLLPPSYPSDASRDPLIPLETSGPFTNTHFRTLHIIYRKSFKSRFHAPAYPDEIRPSILRLVQEKWALQVDESNTMGEDGLFEFTIGGTEARVLERFMREIEHAYENENTLVIWGWSVEELAERLARIAIGETVRKEEKAVEGILRSARKIQAFR